MDALRSYHHEDYHDEYQSNDALGRYWKSSSLQKLVNDALRTRDIDQLYTLRYFLRDLLDNLAHEHLQFDDEKVVVYHQMNLSNHELNQFKASANNLVTMRGLLTANRTRPTAFSSSKKGKYHVPVLFEISCNNQELKNDVIFAVIAQSDEVPHGPDVLFDIGTTFRLDNVEEEETMCRIQLSAVSDGHALTEKYLEDTREQIDGLSVPIVFGRLLCDMTQWDQSQRYFERLSNDSHREDLAWIDYSIGDAHHDKDEWEEARLYYDRAYERMVNTEPARRKDSARVLSRIGEVLFYQGRYEQSNHFAQQALALEKEYYPSDHAGIANSLEITLCISESQLKKNEALTLAQQILTMRKKYYNCSHLDVVCSLIHMSQALEKHTEAFDHVQEAMKILEKYYPSEYTYTAYCVSVLGNIVFRQGNHDEATRIFEHYRRLLQRYNRNDDIFMVRYLNHVALIHAAKEEYDVALNQLHQALTIAKKFYPPYHLDIANLLDVIGSIHQHEEKNLSEGLLFHEQALAILKTSYPSYNIHIAQTLNCMAVNLTKQGKLDEALATGKQALEMQERHGPLSHDDILNSLNAIRDVLCQLGQHDNALQYYQRVLQNQEESSESSQTFVAWLWNAMGNVRFQEKNYDAAIELHQQALTIAKACFPNQPAITATILGNIGHTLYQQKRYDEAVEHLQQALDIRESHLPYTYNELSSHYNLLGNIQADRENHAEALECYQKAMMLYHSYYDISHAAIPRQLMRIAHQKRKQQEVAEALHCYHYAVQILLRFHPTNHISIADGLYWISYLYHEDQDYDNAAEHLDDCLLIREASLPPEQPILIETMMSYVVVEYCRHQYERSLAYELRVFLIREKLLPPNNQSIGESLGRIGELYEKLDTPAAALGYYKQALAIYEQCLPDLHEDRLAMQAKVERLE